MFYMDLNFTKKTFVIFAIFSNFEIYGSDREEIKEYRKINEKLGLKPKAGTYFVQESLFVIEKNAEDGTLSKGLWMQIELFTPKCLKKIYFNYIRTSTNDLEGILKNAAIKTKKKDLRFFGIPRSIKEKSEIFRNLSLLKICKN